MDLEQLKFVKALADEGSFEAAAARCAVALPAILTAITQLEAEFGKRLFRRTATSVRLTPYGEHLLPHILVAIQVLDSLTHHSQTPPTKSHTSVHVGLSPIIGIRRAEAILSRFRAKHPETDVIYHERNFNELCLLLQQRQLDIILAPYDLDTSLNLELFCVSLECDPLIFLPTPSSKPKWELFDSVTLADIANETFVMLSDGCGLASFTKQIFKSHNIVLRQHSGEASGYGALYEWTQAGIGSGILPRSCIADKEFPGIPIVQNGHPVTIEYFALGRPSTISPRLFSQLWDSLLETKIVLPQLTGSLPRLLRLLKTTL
ncbi:MULTISPECIES: LysR family transcriptional regulator [Hyphomicrobium]|jgi:DNA-binding transcriptional LysR family regulator|uniref:LysR family transcriptional regulator n=1 Tax=Hyphomicrobium TaxID=81 RepID=UPI0003637348|nr:MULTISPECIES: LysR family transcriptional regulator [Hyphomicrobium]WBT39787.1 LysR family transcriptional regulator [Hyphomicrobium sp. DMF-1]HML41867.1 LysR family transcriptional regulator [Hyphomicrobium zavarzinii]